MFTPRQIFNQAYSEASSRELADGNGYLAVIKCGVKVSLELKSAAISFKSTCLHDEYDRLDDCLVEQILINGWGIGVYIAAGILFEKRIAALEAELSVQLRKGIKGKRACESLSQEISEMRIKLIKIKNYVRTKINVQCIELSQRQRQD